MRRPISQQKGDFAANGGFRRPFRSCKMELECCERAHVCLEGVLPLWNFSQGRLVATKFGFGGFRSSFHSCEMNFWGSKWHMCA